jgi:alkylation response protein AidB-like acyl-CoA dehydrogenase
METLDAFRTRAHAWLADNADPLPASPTSWGVGSDSVALFKNLTFEEERAHIRAHCDWIRRKADAGFANLEWEPEWGGGGLPRAYADAFAEEEDRFVIPPRHEAIGITIELIAPTIRAKGTREQRDRFLRNMLRTDELWCQMYSEPGSGSDLASVSTKAQRDGQEWVLNGQKVWTSGARHAHWGYALCRSDPSVPKHAGLTAFIVDITAPGVEVRQLRQITGGASFNEVFFTDVRVPDACRLGDPGDGWAVALTTLGFERTVSASRGTTALLHRLVAAARRFDRADDAVIRQLLARAYTMDRVLQLTSRRAAAGRRAGETPGAEGSIGKLGWTETLRALNDVAPAILGPRLGADTGEWGTYAWAELLLGTAGQRIAGGSDEIQRNIVAERVLGLPHDVRVDRGLPFSDVPR